MGAHHPHPLKLPQAIEDETERADQVHAQQEAELRQLREGYEKEIMGWKVKCFDQQYER